MNEFIAMPRDEIKVFCERWKIVEFSLFGSILRKDFRPESDVDILVTFAENAHWSLYDWMDMILELKTMYGREVHLFSKNSLRNPFRRQQILGTREVVYAA